MTIKKGKKWALSFLAVSATALVGMNTVIIVKADELSEKKAIQAQAKISDNEIKDGGNVETDFPNYQQNELGYAAHFHIFANEAHLNTHTNGNVATGVLYGNVNFGTNIINNLVTDDISYIEDAKKIAASSFVSSGDIRKNKVIFGINNEIDFSDIKCPTVNLVRLGNLLKEETYQDKGTNKYIDFEKAFQELASKSQELIQRKRHAEITSENFVDPNNRTIDIRDYQPNDHNQIVLKLSSDVLNSGTPLKIKGLSADAGGTNVVINVDTAGVSEYVMNSQIELYYDNGEELGTDNQREPQETELFDDNHLLWNFYDSTSADQLFRGKVLFDRVFMGSVLSPKAELEVKHNLDGNIIANKINVNGGETHRWDYQNETPEPESIPNPEPDPEPNPEPEPTPIPEPDPEPNLTPDPDLNIDPDLVKVEGSSEYNDAESEKLPANVIETTQMKSALPVDEAEPMSTNNKLPSTGVKSGILAPIVGFMLLAVTLINRKERKK